MIPWFQDTALPPNLNPNSQGALAMMRTWVDECKASHTVSPPDSYVIPENPMPQRLLKIEPDHDTVTLVRTLGVREYALLSYCWGGEQSAATTKANLATYMSGVTVGSLARTIHEAIKLSQRLGISYLWVDSLCT
jgi:hypothetical protein